MAIPALPKNLSVSSKAESGIKKGHKYDSSHNSNAQSGIVFNRYDIKNTGTAGGNLDSNSLLRNKITADFYGNLISNNSAKSDINITAILKSNAVMWALGSVFFYAVCFPKIKKIIRGK